MVGAPGDSTWSSYRAALIIVSAGLAATKRGLNVSVPQDAD